MSSFTVEDLVEAAWLADKVRFGLRHYAELYPDSLRVMCKIYGDGGLVDRGWLELADPEVPKVLRCTPDGLAFVARLAQPVAPSEPPAAPDGPILLQPEPVQKQRPTTRFRTLDGSGGILYTGHDFAEALRVMRTSNGDSVVRVPGNTPMASRRPIR